MSEEVQRVELVNSEPIPVKPPEKKDTNRLESAVKIIGVIVTVVTAILAYLTYNAAEKWKRAEFLASKLKEFSENNSVKIAQTLLDYSKHGVPLFGKDSMVIIKDNTLESALAVDSLTSSFTPVEGRLRDIFDDYFESLSNFNLYAKANLVSYKDLAPHFSYYLEIIYDSANTRKSPQLQKTLQEYIRYYHFKGVQELESNILVQSMRR